MIERGFYLQQLATAVRRSPVTALLGPRQCGKTTLAHAFGQGRQATYFDLESQPDLRRLQNPELILGSLEGLVILDGTRSGYENLTLAIPPSYGVPYRHGYAPIITTRPLGTDTTRSAGLYCRA